MTSKLFDEPLLKPQDYSPLFENWEDKVAYPVKTFKDGLTYGVPTFLSHFKGGNLFFRWMNRKKNHRGFQYKEGLNVDVLKFKPSGSCKQGGLYFASLSTIDKWRRYGECGSFHLIALPSDEIVYVDGQDKFKVHSFILGPEIDFEKFVYRLLEQDFPFERLSVKFTDFDRLSRTYEIKTKKLVKCLHIRNGGQFKLYIENGRVSDRLILGIEEAFRDYTFINCKFDGLKIIDFDFGEAKLRDCSFTNCDLTLSDFSKVDSELTFVCCNLLFTKYNEEKHRVDDKTR